MKISHYSEIASEPVAEPGASGVTIRWLITDKDGQTDFCMRHFEVAPNGYTPAHEHSWEHQVYILEGEGTVLDGDQRRPFKRGDVVFVPPGAKHQFTNTGDTTAQFLCLIPSPRKCSL